MSDEHEIMSKDAEGKNEKPVIQQKIKSKHLKKLKKLLEVVVYSLIAALIFGIAARFVFVNSEHGLAKIFGLDEQTLKYQSYQRNEVIFPSMNPSQTDGGGAGVAEKVEFIGTLDTDSSADRTGSFSSGIEGVGGYKQLMMDLHRISEKVSHSIVTVHAYTSVVNWLSEAVETTLDTDGIIVADNGVELLIVTYYDCVRGADRLTVELPNGNSYGCVLLSYDEDYNMAVVAVTLENIAKEDKNSYSKITFGSATEIYAGMPIIAIGRPNGNAGSVEYGFVTGEKGLRYVTDGSADLFTTDISCCEDSAGIIVNLDGELIGIISRSFSDDSASNTSIDIKVDSVRQVALSLCNGKKRPYLGIKAENMPQNAFAGLSVQNGIYVNDVTAGSPADEADVRKGDIILAVNGQSITSVEAFSAYMLEQEEGQAVTLSIYRSSRTNGQQFDVKLTPTVK